MSPSITYKLHLYLTKTEFGKSKTLYQHFIVKKVTTSGMKDLKGMITFVRHNSC